MKGFCSAVVLLAARSVWAAEPGNTSATADSMWHVALAGGVGHAYGLLGLHVELGKGHWAVFLGGGVQGYAGLAIAAGLRWFSQEGRGLVVSFHADVNPHVLGSNQAPELWATVAVTVGWRFRWDRVFLELGAGPALSYDRYRVMVESTGRFRTLNDVGFGALGPYPKHGPLVPDASVAAGFEF